MVYPFIRSGVDRFRYLVMSGGNNGHNNGNSSATTPTALRDTPHYLCCVRPFEPNDRFAVSELTTAAAMSTVTPFFVAALFREVLWEALVATLALLFVLLHVPGDLCVALLPAFFATVYGGIWAGHRLRAAASVASLTAVTGAVKSPGGGGVPDGSFWVAEVLEPAGGPRCSSAGGRFCLTFVSGDEMRRYADRAPVSQRRRVIGTCGLQPERPAAMTGAAPCGLPPLPAMPTLAGRISRLCVAVEYRRHNVASQLLDAATATAINCGFRQLYALSTECHDAAKALLHLRGFTVLEYTHRSVFPAVSVGLYKFMRRVHPSENSVAYA